MLQLDVQSHPELLDIEARCLPVDADPLSNVASLIGRERAWTHGNQCDGSGTGALMRIAEHPVKAGGCGRRDLPREREIRSRSAKPLRSRKSPRAQPALARRPTARPSVPLSALSRTLTGRRRHACPITKAGL